MLCGPTVGRCIIAFLNFCIISFFISHSVWLRQNSRTIAILFSAVNLLCTIRNAVRSRRRAVIALKTEISVSLILRQEKTLI